MRKVKNYRILIFLLAFTLTGFCQEQKTDQKLVYRAGNPADWPTELDAVIAAPNNHIILLENDKVRVLEVTLQPGEIEAVHHHRWPSVLYIMEAGDFTDADGDGNLIMDSRKLPEPLQFPLTMYKNPEAPHTVTNLSKTKPIRLIRVEMKNSNSSKNIETLKDEVWQMEERYWDYVQKNNTISYKKLWHDDFVGYPSFGDGVSDARKIASWIPELHEDPNQKYSYKLYKKAVNAIDDVVMVFYDADEIWTDKQNKVVRKETFKFTHTWKKYGDTWLILGGMADKKE